MKQRFPTLDHVVDTGFMTKNEKKLFEAVPANEFNTYWVPCTWFIFRLQEATKQGRLLNQYALESIMRVRGICFSCNSYSLLPGGTYIFNCKKCVNWSVTVDAGV